MADEKDPKNQTHPIVETIDPKLHRRVLAFFNAARGAEELLVAPNDRKIANEEIAHTDLVEVEPEERQVLAIEDAQAIIEARDRVSPVNGFAHLRELVALNPGIAELLPGLLRLFGPASHGRWDLLYPIMPGGTTFALEHAALMHTYKVVFLADGTDTAVWDPSDETTPLMSRLSAADTGLAANIVCCGHSFLSDGQLLAVGGGGLGPGAVTSIQGWKFNPATETWNRTAGDMSIKRWYPTAVTLGDESGKKGKSGRVLVASGVPGAGTPPVIDIYSESTDTFSPMTITAGAKTFSQVYPSLLLLPGGQIFYTPTGFGNCSTTGVAALNDPSSYLSFSNELEGNWTDINDGMNRTKGMAALLLQPTYPFVQAFVAGGGPIGTSATAQVANLSTLAPSWGALIAIPDARPRVNVNVVLLPDGTVLVLGGLQSAPLTCYRFNPGTAISPFTEMDELNKPRHYHSAALLLPSGKVMAAGGAAAGGCTVSVENTIEVFSPPYLFNADGSPATRPTITSINGIEPTTTVAPSVNHGGHFNIETPDAYYIAKVVLVRPGAITHNTDTEQRVIQCSFRRGGDYTLCAQAPGGPAPYAIAPRGYYMLFILTGDGVPSEGKFIHLY